MIGVWRKIYPDCVNEYRGFEQKTEEVQQEIVGLMHQAGFNEAEIKDILELLESQSEVVSNEDLM